MNSWDSWQKCQRSKLHRSYTHNTKYRYTHKSALASYSSSIRLLRFKTEKNICISNPSSKSDIIWDFLQRFRKHKVHFRSSQYWSFCMYNKKKSVHGLMTWPVTNSFSLWICMAVSVQNRRHPIFTSVGMFPILITKSSTSSNNSQKIKIPLTSTSVSSGGNAEVRKLIRLMLNSITFKMWTMKKLV